MSDTHSQPADVSAPSGETSKAELGDVAEEPDSPEPLHGIAPSTAPDRTSNSANNGSSNGEAAAPRTLMGLIRQIFGLRNRSTGRQDLEEVLGKRWIVLRKIEFLNIFEERFKSNSRCLSGTGNNRKQ